jgi:hypothetical protein
MRSKIGSRVVWMTLLMVLVFGSVATASAPQPGRCRQACNEAFREHLARCRNLPRGERRVCEARAKAAHQHCLRRCKNS